jgi:hypothetical protein
MLYVDLVDGCIPFSSSFRAKPPETKGFRGMPLWKSLWKSTPPKTRKNRRKIVIFSGLLLEPSGKLL